MDVSRGKGDSYWRGCNERRNSRDCEVGDEVLKAHLERILVVMSVVMLLLRDEAVIKQKEEGRTGSYIECNP